MPVNLSTVHHEGAGQPCPTSQVSRFAEGGYSYAIASDGWVRFRSPASSCQRVMASRYRW